ncbi:hypothetical protein X769_08605 [Mesorhizobium sp. LSJC268A00]|uniref:hypothetical protein n=1 Tax=unclassified Mesorhizobium TaxID=325217 RepID=UPI0003CF32F7|nr:hypothetical protein [Mesorhizobium sp. LSJC268A00]ESX07249.1 hypothetical protein X769_08605 [Mesorhizobium sp. LSJC268A00]
MLIVAELHSDPSDGETPVLALAKFRDAVLVPTMNVQSAAETFQRVVAEELAVVEDFDNRVVVGLLTKGHLMRRYAEELDKARRHLSGEEQASAGILKCPGACHVYSVTVQIVQWEKKTG